MEIVQKSDNTFYLRGGFLKIYNEEFIKIKEWCEENHIQADIKEAWDKNMDLYIDLYCIKTEFLGALITFEDKSDAIAFKLTWI